ncbi:hypothetical protein PRIC2_012442 [Phytophthora ramorum]
MFTSRKISALCLAVVALSSTTHAEQEAAQTFGLLGAGLPGIGVGIPGVASVGVGGPGVVAPGVSVGVPGVVGMGGLPYGTDVSVGASALGVGVPGVSVGVPGVASVGVNAAPAVGVHDIGVDTGAGRYSHASKTTTASANADMTNGAGVTKTVTVRSGDGTVKTATTTDGDNTVSVTDGDIAATAKIGGASTSASANANADTSPNTSGGAKTGATGTNSVSQKTYRNLRSE